MSLITLEPRCGPRYARYTLSQGNTCCESRSLSSRGRHLFFIGATDSEVKCFRSRLPLSLIFVVCFDHVQGLNNMNSEYELLILGVISCRLDLLVEPPVAPLVPSLFFLPDPSTFPVHGTASGYSLIPLAVPLPSQGKIFFSRSGTSILTSLKDQSVQVTQERSLRAFSGSAPTSHQ